MSQIRTAKTVFLTLGLTETWTDVVTGIVMNNPLGGMDLRRHKERFTFTNYGYQEVLNELEYFIALVRDTCNSDMHFVVTVSPVPLGVTFTASDIIVANTHSKSTLRAVAATISSKLSYVDYFPSYELVIHSPRTLAWKADQLHVQDGMVEHVMQEFVNAYWPQ